MERYTSVTGVHLALGDNARKGVCPKCGERKLLYPWPLAGLGVRCAACVVVESGGLTPA